MASKARKEYLSPSQRKGEKKETGIWVAKDGKGYIAEVSYRDPETGMRVREFATINRLDSAKQWRETRKADALRGEIRRTKKRVPKLFKDFADEYCAAWSLDRKPNTAEREKRRIEKELVPQFGKRPLHTITRKNIEDYITRKRDGGASPATANRSLCRLKSMFRKATDWGYLDSNPAAGIRQAREPVKEADFLSREEVSALLKACGRRLRPIVLTAVYTGMRFGELMALEWRDIEFGRALITVRDPKNRETRHVPMNPTVVEALREHRQEQARKAGGIVPLLFANPQTGTPYKDIRKSYKAALKEAGITRGFTFHGLRHTAASHLIMAGVDLRTVGKILGHKTAQITLRYAHLAPDYLQGAIERLDYSDEDTEEVTQEAGEG